ncbi:DUF3850 domain-containing protein [Brucella pituitosa]|uniref:DUF3850 domain-containing protein n=1 Tax=Brucella pituitosa TaxID=571256 RepID=UPI003F4A9731
MQTHDLKIDTIPFADLLSGAKTAEVRNDDRGFNVGDTVRLTCTDDQTMDRTISHIQRGYGLPDGICVLSYTSPAAPVEGLETVAYQYQIPRNGHWDNLPSDWTADECKAYDKKETRELVTRSQAETIIADLHAAIVVKDHGLKLLEADNAALTAWVKELEHALTEKRRDRIGDSEKGGAYLCRAENAEAKAEALETQLSAARKALEFYGDVHKYPAPLTGGMGALWSDCGAIARAVLGGKPSC